VTSCILVDMYRRFGGTFYLHGVRYRNKAVFLLYWVVLCSLSPEWDFFGTTESKERDFTFLRRFYKPSAKLNTGWLEENSTVDLRVWCPAVDMDVCVGFKWRPFQKMCNGLVIRNDSSYVWFSKKRQREFVSCVREQRKECWVWWRT
jgi:hypothetical protein